MEEKDDLSPPFIYLFNCLFRSIWIHGYLFYSLGYNPILLKLLFFINLFIYLFIFFIFGCVGSSFLCEGFLQLRRAGATLHRGERASHRCGLSHCGAQAPDTQAQ